jgi:hypothetical protein
VGANRLLTSALLRQVTLRLLARDHSRALHISKALLEAVGENPEAAGLKFQAPNTLQGLGVEAMTAKVLCERHNHALSPLDAEATRFFQALRDFDKDLRDAVESETPRYPWTETRLSDGCSSS